MAGNRDSIEEIRSRISVLEIVSEYVTIKRAGKTFKGLCPFHPEKTPSFTVSEVFGTWHCFGCGEHGDIFTFLMKAENLTFPEALERLAKRAGVELPEFGGREKSRREILFGINSLAAGYYFTLLAKADLAADYLKRRGLADETIKKFRLGYASPAWDGLFSYLSKKGVNADDAAEAGLIIKSERGSYYDRFRNRIIFPILDIQDRIIGFGGRAIGDDQPKYLNSPETPLFNKTRSLYGLNFGRKAIADGACAIVVEGYMDVIAAHQAGFTNCVATLGTALTPKHINILERYTKRVVLAYDADSAGIKAALRGAAMFEESECDVRILRLPKGEDPDSLIRHGRGAEFDAAVKGALPIAGYKIEVLKDRFDLSAPAGREAMLKNTAKVLAEVPSFAERERYIKEVAVWHPNFGTGTTLAEDHIRADVEAQRRRKEGSPHAQSQALRVPKAFTAVEKAERLLLRAIITGEAGAEHALKELSPQDFTGEASKCAAEVIYEMFTEKRGIYLPELLEKTGDTGRFLSELVMKDDAPPINEKVLQDCVALIKNSRLKRRRGSDVLAPYIRDGIIDPGDWPKGEAPEEYEEYLRQSGKLGRADE
ncbi:MAG: DNA primase [Armatimonadota bacterium]